jgi:predicted RNA-binding Zn-ribbon protein involved in translation (DUF1610 family)
MTPNGDLIHIQDAGRGKTGLTCPDCGAALIARKGAVKAHHFAHYDSEECVAAGETALHREAKNLLMANPELLLPELMVLSERRLQKQIVRLDAIEIETWEGGFRPDLRATMSSGAVTRTLYIEIRVTHPVDALKLEKVRDAGHSMIEIDLSSVNRELARAELSSLLRETAPRTWLHHRRMAEFKIEILEARNQLRLREEEAARQATKRTEQERTAREVAKNRAPSKGTAAQTSVADQQVLKWQALGKDRFFTLVADDHVFDVPPTVWRTKVLSYFAPWVDGEANERDSMSLARMAERAFNDIRRVGWFKPEFLAWDPKTRKIYAFAAIAGFLATVTERDEGCSTTNSKAPDLSSFRRSLQAKHKDNLELLDRAKRIERDLVKEHGVRFGAAPQGLSPSSNGTAWLARANISKTGTYSTSRLLNSLSAVLGPKIKGTETCPTPEELASIGLGIFKEERDITGQFLSERQTAVNQLARNERDRKIDTELGRLMLRLAPALHGLEAMGPWPATLHLDLLPRENSLRELLECGAVGPLTSGEADDLRARAQNAEAIIEPVARIWELTKDLALERLMRSLRNILVRDFLKIETCEAGAIYRLQSLSEALAVLKPLVVSLAEVEKRGQYAMERTTPEDFALRSLLSSPETGSRNIIQCALCGDFTTARRLTNEITVPRSKPAWIIKELPTAP